MRTLGLLAGSWCRRGVRTVCAAALCLGGAAGIGVLAAPSDAGASQSAIVVNPTLVAFGAVHIGTVATAVIVVTNTTPTNKASYGIGSIYNTLATGEFSIVPGTTSCALTTVATLTPAGACGIYVEFTPTTGGQEQGHIVVITGTLGTTTYVIVNLTGLATSSYSLSTNSLAFGTVGDGDVSAPQTVTLSGKNQFPALEKPPSVTPTSDYTITATDCRSARSFTSCTVSVQFNPDALGTINGSLTFTTATGLLTVSLTGTGIDNTTGFFGPASLTFGTVPVGTTSAAETATVTNTGANPMAFGDATPRITGNDPTTFSVVNDTCQTVSVAPGDFCTVSVVFTPTSPSAARSATVMIAVNVSNAGVNPLSLHVRGNGTTTKSDLRVTPPFATFGSLAVGAESHVQYFTITDTGQATALTTVTVTGGAGYSLTTDTCTGVTLGNGDTCTIGVQFDPLATGPDDGTVTITVTRATPVVLPLFGEGTTAFKATLSPASLTFGPTATDTESPEQVVTLTNNGTAVLSTITVTVDGTDSSDFTTGFDSCSAGDLAPGDTCSIAVYFDPEGAATGLSALLVVTDTAGQQTVTLSGTGTESTSAVSITNAHLDFGSQGVGLTSEPMTATLTDTGTQPVRFGPASYSGADTATFTILAPSSCATATLDPVSAAVGNTSCTVVVTFTPDATGSRSAFVDISQATTGPLSQILLNGTGVADTSASVAPTALTFGAVPVGTSSAAQRVTVKNTGTNPLFVAGDALNGNDPGSFDVVDDTCTGATVPPGATCTLSVLFSPTAPVATQSAVLDIGANVSGTGTATPLSVELYGSGITAGSGLSASPPSLTFGSVGTTLKSPIDYVTVTNHGQTVTLGTVFVTGSADYTLSADTCSTTGLAEGTTCRIGVTFEPTVLGTDDATLVIPVTGGPNLEVGLYGNGIPDTSVSFSPSSLTFPTTTIGKVSPQQLIQVSDTGSAPLVVTTIEQVGGNDPGNWKIVTDTCETNIVAPGNVCWIGVDFAPTVKGSLTGSLLVFDNGGGSPQLIALYGAATAPGTGYDLVGSDGGVFVFDAPGQLGGFYGSLPGIHVTPAAPIVGIVPTLNDKGYFLVGADGGVFSFGNAPFLGSLPGIHVTPNQPITGIVAANTDKGYFLVGRDGGVFAFGTVPFLGSLPGKGVSVDNIIGIASTPTGNGYWIISATGTVYGFGAANSLGTVKGSTSPVSAIAGTPTGNGYWVSTENGGVDAFGNANKVGTLPSINVVPTLPVIGIVPTATFTGYWLLGADGGVFAFNAPYVGSLPGLGIHVDDIVGAVPN